MHSSSPATALRTRLDPELELVDTGIFDAGWWEITADYAKASPEDLLIRLHVRNAGREAATLDVLPTLWFRNTWSWGIEPTKPSLALDGEAIVADHATLGRRWLSARGAEDALFCENETNAARVFGASRSPRFPKDGINDHVVRGDATIDPDRVGTKAAFRFRVTVDPGATATIDLRLNDVEPGVGTDFDEVLQQREREADEFYAALRPAGASDDEALVLRQALAGMLWSKQFYHYDVRRWLDGDPAEPTPPAERLRGRNANWRHLNNMDVISMPDPWEYPWYASWDLAFHCVALAHVDAEFAKQQLVLLCREWFMHPNGQLPAYEWDFGDVNPPVQAWAALRVFEIDGSHDTGFLERVLHKLLLNFTWWVNREDRDGSNLFEGGFLGLDNIGPFNRSQVPVHGTLEQSDGTSWMALYCQNLLELALELARRNATYEDIATKFFEHFALIASALNERGLWHEADGFYYDALRRDDGELVPLRARSVVGLLPIAAALTIGPDTMERLPDFHRRTQWFTDNSPDARGLIQHVDAPDHAGWRLISIVDEDRLRRLLAPMLDENEFLSPHGLRALSKWHAQHPLRFDLDGVEATLDYEPAESASPLFGGNSNWRGPVWLPVNYLLICALRTYHRYFGSDCTVECPTGSGVQMSLAQVADELTRRIVAIFLRGTDGRRPVFGDYELLQREWSESILFHEYFHGETGAGLGASHQTGWTGLVADLIIRGGKDTT
jgi:hypothetical protein